MENLKNIDIVILDENGEKDFSFKCENHIKLNHGHNAHQEASLFLDNTQIDYELMGHQLMGYSDFQDIDTAIACVSGFYDVPTAVIVKNNVVIGASIGADIDEAILKAVDTEPLSIKNSVVALSQKVTSNKIIDKLNFKTVIAPDFEVETKTNRVKVNTPLKDYKRYLHKDIEITPLGILMQDCDVKDLGKDNFKVIGKVKPTAEMVQDMLFAWKIAKYTKTDSAVVAKDLKTSGIAQCFGNTVSAVEFALDKACENSKDAVIAINGEVLSEGVINACIQGRIKGIIYSGNFELDLQLAKLANKYEITLISTNGLTNKRI